MSKDALSTLQTRARQLAERPPDETRARLALTVFRRAGSFFGFPVSEVEGAGRLRELSPIPGGASWMAGVIQHRGEVLTLVDLPTFWGNTVPGVADFPTYIVISNGTLRLGLLVEELYGVREMENKSVLYEGVERVGLVEVARLGAEPVMVLSAKRLLGDARFQL